MQNGVMVVFLLYCSFNITYGINNYKTEINFNQEKYLLTNDINLNNLPLNHNDNISSQNDSLLQHNTETQQYDILENYNRNAFRLNTTLDRYVLDPITMIYVSYVPDPLRNSIGNFFNNLSDFITLSNDILQVNGLAIMQNFMRICINSTVGILGLIDVASGLGLERKNNTFGNTLRKYGWTNSSYLVLPLLGPSTIRDAFGLVPDLALNPTWYIIPSQYNYLSASLFTLNQLNIKEQTVKQYGDLLKTSLDPYITIRDLYLSQKGEKIPTQNIEDFIENYSSEENNITNTQHNTNI